MDQEFIFMKDFDFGVMGGCGTQSGPFNQRCLLLRVRKYHSNSVCTLSSVPIIPFGCLQPVRSWLCIPLGSSSTPIWFLPISFRYSYAEVFPLAITCFPHFTSVLYSRLHFPSWFHTTSPVLSVANGFIRAIKASLVRNLCFPCETAKNCPSELAKPSEYEKIQAIPEDRIPDDLPQGDHGILWRVWPVYWHRWRSTSWWLQCQALGSWVGCWRVRRGHVHILSRRRYQSKRRANFNQQNICSKERWFPSNHYSDQLVQPHSPDVRTDGHFTGDHGVLIVIGKFKNRSTGISGQPKVEMVGYFAHSFAGSPWLESLPNMAEWRVPAVGISIVDISRMLQDRFCLMLIIAQAPTVLESWYLTSAFSYIHSLSKGRDRSALYRAFTAASIRILESHVRTLVQTSYIVRWDGWPPDHPFVPFWLWPSGKLSTHWAVGQLGLGASHRRCTPENFGI